VPKQTQIIADDDHRQLQVVGAAAWGRSQSRLGGVCLVSSILGLVLHGVAGRLQQRQQQKNTADAASQGHTL
jgi:hypothetical protein